MNAAAAFGLAAMVAVTAAAAWVGDRAAKRAAAAVAAAWLGTLAVQTVLLASSRTATQVVVLLIDLALLVALAWLATRHRRLWLTVAAAFPLMMILTQLSWFADLRIRNWAFYTAYFVWSYGLLLVVAWGTVEAVVRERRAARG